MQLPATAHTYTERVAAATFGYPKVMSTASSPGAMVRGYYDLHDIHVRLKQLGVGGTSSRFEIVQRDGEWWLAAGQNTPIRPGLSR